MTPILQATRALYHSSEVIFIHETYQNCGHVIKRRTQYMAFFYRFNRADKFNMHGTCPICIQSRKTKKLASGRFATSGPFTRCPISDEVVLCFACGSDVHHESHRGGCAVRVDEAVFRQQFEQIDAPGKSTQLNIGDE